MVSGLMAAEAGEAAVVWIGAAANVLIFLFSPFYCSYRSVRQFEARMGAIERALPHAGALGDTVIVSFDSHFLGFRHAGYYFPGYLTLEYPEAHLLEGTRIFSMQGGETRLLTGLPSHPPSRFVLFPLPTGNQYQQYLKKVFDRFRRRACGRFTQGGTTLLRARPRICLFSFPQSRRAPSPEVYMALHTGTRHVNSRAH